MGKFFALIFCSVFACSKDASKEEKTVGWCDKLPLTQGCRGGCEG